MNESTIVAERLAHDANIAVALANAADVGIDAFHWTPSLSEVFVNDPVDRTKYAAQFDTVEETVIRTGLISHNAQVYGRAHGIRIAVWGMATEAEVEVELNRRLAATLRGDR